MKGKGKGKGRKGKGRGKERGEEGRGPTQLLEPGPQLPCYATANINMKTLKLLIKTGFFDKINDVMCFEFDIFK